MQDAVISCAAAVCNKRVSALLVVFGPGLEGIEVPDRERSFTETSFSVNRGLSLQAMSISARTRRSSRPSESRYETWTRGDITTNDAPEYSPGGYRSTRSNYLPDPSHTEIAFNTPTVAPSESISKVQSRRDGARNYTPYSRQGASVSSRRPPMRARYSSDEGTSWSRSRAAALTENNLEAFNESKSTRRQRTEFTTNSSHRPSRRASNTWDGEQMVEDRNVAYPSERGSRHRSTYVQDDYVARSQARSARDQSESSMPTEAIAAVAAGNAMAQNNGPARSRAPKNPDPNAPTTITSRRASRAPSTTQNKAVAAYQSTQVEGNDTRIQTRVPSATSESRPSPPRDLTSPMAASSSAEIEWERRVHIREYRRPSDGKLIQDRETVVRKLNPLQAPRLGSAVQA